VDAATRAQLNVSAAARVEQLRINLERWRWLPQDLGRRHITVNIASQELQVIEDGEVVIGMRVVVGRELKRTHGVQRYRALHRAQSQLACAANHRRGRADPKIQRDPTYLERFGMHLFTAGPDPQEVDPSTIDWSTVTADSFPYRVRQDPGRLNALGRIKFMFPIANDIYLHDTPSRGLFVSGTTGLQSRLHPRREAARSRRVPHEEGRWDRAAIEGALDEGTERAIYLPRPVSIICCTGPRGRIADGTDSVSSRHQRSRSEPSPCAREKELRPLRRWGLNPYGVGHGARQFRSSPAC